jgi:hypothetical protein
MGSHSWPQYGSFKVTKVIDDHTDIIGVNIVTDCRKYGGKKNVTREINFNRFWKLDEDNGLYLITFSSMHDDVINDNIDINKKNSNKVEALQIIAVLTISPRKDHNEFDNDINESLLCCTCQVSNKGLWSTGEQESFMDNFLIQHLIALKHNLLFKHYGLENKVNLDNSDNGMKCNFNGPISKVSNISNSTNNIRFSRFNSTNGNELINRIDDNDNFDDDVILTNPPKKRLFRRNIPDIPESTQQKINTNNSNIRSNSDDLSISPPKFDKNKSHSGTSMSSGEGNSPKLAQSPLMSSRSPSALQSLHGSDISVDSNISTINNYNINNNNEKHISRRRRSKLINSQALSLRGLIATKEYEVQRLERALKKDNEIKNKDIKHKDNNYNTDNDNSDNNDDNNNLVLIHQQLLELQHLKSDYVLVTGEPYEPNQRQKGSLNRLRYLKRNEKHDQNIAIANAALRGLVVLGLSNNKGMKDNICKKSSSLATNIHRRPNHWQPTKMNRSNLIIGLNDDNNEVILSKSDVAFISVFAMLIVSLISTLLFANWVSSF